MASVDPALSADGTTITGQASMRAIVWRQFRRHPAALISLAVLGVIIFIESNITVLVAGSISRPLFDRYRVSREKLAYLIDSTSAPVCVLIPFNAWGAYILGVLATLGIADPVPVLVASIPLNFYAIAALIVAAVAAFKQVDIGPMPVAGSAGLPTTTPAKGATTV